MACQEGATTCFECHHKKVTSVVETVCEDCFWREDRVCCDCHQVEVMCYGETRCADCHWEEDARVKKAQREDPLWIFKRSYSAAVVLMGKNHNEALLTARQAIISKAKNELAFNQERAEELAMTIQTIALEKHD